MRNGRIGNMNV